MVRDMQPYDSGLLDAGDGNGIYWEACGNPKGVPALYVHGGPGSGCTRRAGRFFDPNLFRIVLFDQRGCGRSRPLLTDSTQLQNNTTQHLLSDMELLRSHLSVERWVVLGGSWGTTLSLAYAQAHPERVAALVLACITTTSRREVEWITHGVGAIFPEQWERFAAAVPGRLKDLPIVDAYAEMLFDSDPAACDRAATEWCAWEDAHVSLSPNRSANARFEDPEFRLRFARLVTHYWKNAAFLEEDQLIRDAAILNGIPGELIHGRYDVSSPLETAWRLSKIWTSSTLRVLDDAGHGDGQPFASTIIAALDTMARTAAF